MLTMNPGSASNTIDSYRKRQQRGPVIIWGIAALLVIVGIIILVVVFTGDNKPQISLFATETPTATLTYTPTVTSSPTSTSTATMTPTLTLTPTPSAPFSYIIQENESLVTIAEKFELGDDGIFLLLALNPVVEQRGFLLAAEEILIPNPGMKLPTATPVPFDLPRGTELEYTIRSGDTIAAIAEKFRSTEDDIITANELENVNTIQVGQILIIPANMVTPEPTRLPPTAPADSTATPATPAATATTVVAAVETTVVSETLPAPTTCSYQENQEYLSQIFELVNNERVTRGLTPLEENPELSAAAMSHAVDMACNNFRKETGSNGATLTQRLTAQGYTASFSIQAIHAQPPEYGGDGNAAVKAWLEEGNALLDPNVTQIGIGYAFYRQSSFGGYFNVVLAAPAQ